MEDLPAAVYHYRQESHGLRRTAEGDLRRQLAAAAHGQAWLANAPAVLVIAAVHRRTAGKYGTRAERYVAMEAGHAGQSVYLQATALGLGSVMVGAFGDDRVRELLALPPGHRPLALMPLGRPR